MKVSIVIPNWNGEEKLKKHLPGVLQIAKANGVYEVIVADDASTDGSVQLLKSDFPEVTLVERNKNGGFSSNVNTGVLKAGGDLVFLLNTDAGLDKDVFKFALPHFESPDVFSVGCKVGDGSWATGRFEHGFFWHGEGEKNLGVQGGQGGLGGKSHRTLWASGGSGIFRKSIWDDLRGLDELFNPFYEEDVDLGYRATKRGYINIWEPKARVEHYKEVGVIEEHFSKSKITEVAERNHLIFIWKNITSEKLFTEHKKALARMLLQHPKYWGTFLTALRNLPEIKRKREAEKKESKLSDEEVFNIFHGEKD